MAITELAAEYGVYSTRPSALLNSIFTTTVNTAAKTLVAVASRAKAEHADKWRVADHLRFVLMLMTWLAVWVLRVLMDHFPFFTGPSYSYLIEGNSNVGSFDLLPSSSLLLSSSSDCSMDLVLHEASDEASVKALGRALSHILALLNEIPASSRKYQFAVAMADRIVDENTRDGHVEVLQINRAALASAFMHTCTLLCRSLQSSQSVDDSGTWTTRVISSLPFGSLLASSAKGLGFCVRTMFPLITSACGLQTQGQLAIAGGGGGEVANDVAAEKYAQELVWLANKMRGCGAVDEAFVQWSLASTLASLSLTANPRVQAFIVKISAILFGELTRANMEVPRVVKFRLLVLWIPLFCYADNGLAYPVLTGYEKAEMERIMNELISSLPSIDQEAILTNWLQDFTMSPSDWPNLQVSFDRWCHSTRKLIT